MTAGVTKKLTFNDDKMHLIKSQNVDEALKAIAALRDQPKGKGLAEGRHVGSVPTILAVQWMRECGHPVGTKEWNKYAAKKLRSEEFRTLRVHG